MCTVFFCITESGPWCPSTCTTAGIWLYIGWYRPWNSTNCERLWSWWKTFRWLFTGKPFTVTSWLECWTLARTLMIRPCNDKQYLAVKCKWQSLETLNEATWFLILKPQSPVEELFQFVIYSFIHLQVIITHGLCHLLGYTHDTQNNLNKVSCPLMCTDK